MTNLSLDQKFDAVIEFASKLKADMIARGMVRGKRRCPAHTGRDSWVRARLVPGRGGQVLRMACDEAHCHYRLLE